MKRFGSCVEKYLVRNKGIWRKFYAEIIGYTHIGGYIRFLYVKHLLKRISYRRILDIGCGDGSFSFYFAQKYPNIKIDSFDISKDKITKCQAILNELPLKNIEFFCKDLRETSFSNEYDLVLMIDVLEHIPITDSHLVIKKLREAIKPGGYLLLHLPIQEPKRIFNESFFKKTAVDVKATHKDNLWNTHNVVLLLTNNGFVLKKVRNTFGFLGKLLWEIDKIIYENIEAIYIIVFPLLKISCWIESYLHYKQGNGILIFAMKV